MATFKLTLEYDGTDFEGWQQQPAGSRTVQGVLRAAFEEIGASATHLMGAGRTDAGVHAEGQVASVAAETGLDAKTLVRALNANLPYDVAVVDACPAPAGFDARRHARAKCYRYLVWNGPARAPLRARRSMRVPGPLDVGAMQAAARHLVGTHDFASFQAAGSTIQGTERTLHRVDVAGLTGGEVRFTVEGSGFLRHMVRNLVGTLLEVGAGRREADALPALLQARDRRRAGPTAAAAGLTLLWVAYPDPLPG